MNGAWPVGSHLLLYCWEVLKGVIDPVINQGLFKQIGLPVGCRPWMSLCSPCVSWWRGISWWCTGSPWGCEVLLICISGLQAQPGVFGVWRKISLTQMTFSLLYNLEENQALNLESCRRSTRSPLANVQCVRERNANTDGSVVWQLPLNYFLNKT